MLELNELEKYAIESGAGFYLGIYEKNTGKYRFSGKIHIKDYCKDEVIESTVWKMVNSEKEMVKTLEELIDNLTGRKVVYGEWDDRHAF